MRYVQNTFPKSFVLGSNVVGMRNRTGIYKFRRKSWTSWIVKSSSTSSSPPKSSYNFSKVTSFLSNVRATSYNFLTIVWKSLPVITYKVPSAPVASTKTTLNPSLLTFLKEHTKVGPRTINIKYNEHEHLKDAQNGSKFTASKKIDPSHVLHPLAKEAVREETDLEKAVAEWWLAKYTKVKESELQGKDQKVIKKVESVVSRTQTVSKADREARSRFLVKSLATASSQKSQFTRLKEMCDHLLQNPQEKNVMAKEGAIRLCLRLREKSSVSHVQNQAREVLALLGHTDPPCGRGIRILSIDGGGTRGVIAIETLRQLEHKTGKQIHELFDFMCGVSTGAILTTLLGGLRKSLDECDALYKKLSLEVFSQSAWWGTGRLVWNHAYYDTNIWTNVLKETFGDMITADCAQVPNNPKLAVVSTAMNLPVLRAFVFRNYEVPFRVQSPYIGSSSEKMWEAVRASGAAPGYFEEFCLKDIIHQDGGLMLNNCTALAIHEAKLLWPGENIQCVISLGNGRYIPPTQKSATSTSLKTKVMKIVDSATDTEAVHTMLNDLLPPSTYFRLNPYLSEFVTLDEKDANKLYQLKVEAQMYLRRNEWKVNQACSSLIRPRGYLQKTCDWLSLKKKIHL